jgi:hypothetical protein
MMRVLYRALVRLHPPAFQERFGPEMMRTFDEASETDHPVRLTLDGAFSLLRQWLLRETLWKYPAALGAALLVIVTGIRLPATGRPHQALHPEGASVELFLVAALASLIAVSLTTIFCVYWFRMANRPRRSGTR